MITISLCMIVKNEEEVLARCLDSVHDLVDEIIIVDTGSTDRTKEIAAQYTNKIYDFEWINDFSAARNFSFSKATMDYQLWLDADDVILEKDQIKFRELKENMSPDIDMVLMKYVLTEDEKGNSINSLLRERIVKRVNYYLWEGAVHECIIYGGNYLVSDIEIFHKEKSEDEISSERNLKIYEEQIEKGITLSSRSLFYYARELRDHGRVAMSIRVFNEFLLTKQGSMWDNISACLDMGRMYRKIGSDEDALKVLLHSFTYDLPTAEICCEIASIYAEKQEFQKAIFWYNLIFSLKIPENYTNQIIADCWDFIPAIEMCVCYHVLGDKQNAIRYNNLAATYKPDHPSVLANQDLFVRMQEKTAYYVTERMRMQNLNLI